MIFEKPEVEFISIASNGLVVAEDSPNGPGGVDGCKGNADEDFDFNCPDTINEYMLS